VSNEYDRRWELWRHWSWEKQKEWWKAWGQWSWTKAGDFKKETNSINYRCNMFSNAYFLLHVCSKAMKLILTIIFSVETSFLVKGHLAFRIIFLSSKHGGTL
jgi:hypothetical protein